MGLVSELRRRNVDRMAVLYVVAAWLIMQVAEVLVSLQVVPPSIGPILFAVLATGFPIALIISWFYELTPEGIKPERDVDRADSITQITGRRMDFVIISLLCAAVIFLAYDKWWAGGPPEQSIAVLPFVNLSDDPGGEYLGDGIAEELLNELANLETLHVAARTSSFHFKGKSEPVSSIARQLGVGTVLEGSVRRSGDRLRITAQLINAENGYHLWSETFDQKVGDIFAIQEEIAQSIRDALEVKVLGKASRKLAAIDTENFDAYDYFLLGQYHRDKRNPESLARSIELLNKALTLDDRFALGYTALAWSYLYQAYYSDLSPERVVDLTTPLFERSLELNPQLAEAHLVRASVRLLVGDYAAADAGCKKALELKPNSAGAWASLGFSLVLQSRLKEAEEAYARAEVLDPVNASLKYNIGALMMLTGRYEEGVAATEQVIALAPERVGPEGQIAHWSIAYGRYEQAAEWIVRLLERQPDSAHASVLMATVFGDLGMWDQAWESISLAHEKAPDDAGHISRVANFYFRTGNYSQFSEFVADEYDKVDQMAPTRYSPTNKLRYFWHGFAAIHEGNYEQAIDDLTNAAGGPGGIENLVYDEITAIKYMAYALQQQGRYDEAAELLNKCLTLATDAIGQGWATPMINVRTAQVYALLGQPDDAAEQLQQAVDKGWKGAGHLLRDFDDDPLWYRVQDDGRIRAIMSEAVKELEVQRERVTLLLGQLLIDQ